MGRTQRHEETGDRRFKKLKGQNHKRERNKGKAKLSNLVTFKSQRHIPNAETLAAMEELDNLELVRDEDGNVKTFATVEELLKELNDDTEQEGRRNET